MKTTRCRWLVASGRAGAAGTICLSVLTLAGAGHADVARSSATTTAGAVATVTAAALPAPPAIRRRGVRTAVAPAPHAAHDEAAGQAGATGAVATLPPVPAGQAGFVVRVIEASRASAPAMDPRLAEMQRDLAPFQGRFNVFTLVREDVFALAPGGVQAVALPAGASFGLQFVEFQEGRVRRVRYTATAPGGGKTTRLVAPGGRTLDAIASGERLTVVSTQVR